MGRLVLVCGPTGAGKTTYSRSLCEEIDAVQFSIDPWMHTLFSKDMKALDYSWMIERVNRCYEQIWQVAEQILALDRNAVLDLGFTTQQQRQVFVERAKAIGISAELHYLDAPRDIRKKRIHKRNQEKDPDVYAFDVTDSMFEFMEPKFEIPDSDELEYGRTVLFENDLKD